MKKADLSAMTVAELKALAKQKNVSLSAGAKKADIVAALMTGVTMKKSPAKKTIAKKATATKKSATKRAAKAGKASGEKKRGVSAGEQPKTISAAREWKRRPSAEEPFMIQERVSKSKYYTGPEQPIAASCGELPQGYGEEKIALLPRDPHVAYAYWEVTPERLEREKAWFGWESKLSVRIYDVTGVQFDGQNAVGYFDQEVFERIGSWYFDLGRPCHAFCAELGLISPQGRFLTLARSAPIAMPRDTVSDVIDDEWMLLDEEFMRLYGIPSGLSSPQMLEMLKRRRELEITSPGMFSRPRVKRK